MRRAQRATRKQKKKVSFRSRPVRRSQLITPFGVGAITDFRHDEALMCAGIDAWFGGKQPPDELTVSEERLQSRLSCNFFVLPPEFDDNPGGSRERVPYVRFPCWHYCPSCFRMKRTTLFGDQMWCDSCPRARRTRRMIPVRFVAVCDDGHIQDFPFREWIGCQCADESACELYFKPGRSAASLAGIRIECVRCGRSNTMAGAFRDGALFGKGVRCAAAQPWLGRLEGKTACGKQLLTVQRGGSNVYFPAVASSIYIPQGSARLDPSIKQVLDDPVSWTLIANGPVEQRADRLRVIAALKKVDIKALTAAVEERLNAHAAAKAPGSEEAYRAQEYDALVRGCTDPQSELYCEIVEGAQYLRAGAWLERIGLVKSLRETRVLHGFSRLVPSTDIRDRRLQPLSRVQAPSWLPAMVVHGEGLFIQFRAGALADWAAQNNVRDRIRTLSESHRDAKRRRGLPSRAIDGRFVLLHTLAHALIRELSFRAGYGSASLRERIFCNLEPGSAPMAGILIYTASGDAEGTLGGLVALGKPSIFEDMIESAITRAQWCSNDPVCIEGQLSSFENLAACHGCALLPETSCEEGNRLLDRGVIVGKRSDPSLGFFNAVGLSGVA